MSNKEIKIHKSLYIEYNSFVRASEKFHGKSKFDYVFIEDNRYAQVLLLFEYETHQLAWIRNYSLPIHCNLFNLDKIELLDNYEIISIHKIKKNVKLISDIKNEKNISYILL